MNLRLRSVFLCLNKSPGPDGIHGQMIDHLGLSGRQRFLDIINCSCIESVIKRKCEVGAFADDIVLWKSDSDLTKLERDINLVLEDIRNFALDHKLTLTKYMVSFFTANRKLYNFQPNIFLYNQPLTINKHPKCLGIVLDPEILGNKHIDNIVFKARKRLNILRYIPGRDWGADVGTLRNTCISLISPILEYGVPVYCNASVTILQKLEKVQLSAARIITGLKNTCPRDIVLFEADLLLLSFRRRACLTKYNTLRSLDSRNRTSAYFKDWCNNQKLRRNSPFSQMVSFNLTIGAVEPHHLSECLDPANDLVGVFFHPEYYQDGSRDGYYRSGSGIYIKSQDHILRIQRRNSDGGSVFRSELIAIDGRSPVPKVTFAVFTFALFTGNGILWKECVVLPHLCKRTLRGA
ncbi:RNase H domain-containing protein [Trichonephila clavipes]|nr:RNase H domain-containing protein [Trichonephila clavipes]